MRDITLGRTEISMSGIKLPNFDRKRSIVDAFRVLSREIAIKALKTAFSAKTREERVDPEKLRQDAKRLRALIEPYLLAVSI